MKSVIKFFRILIAIVFILPVLILLGVIALVFGSILRLLKLDKLSDKVSTLILQPVVWWIMFFLGTRVKIIGKENLPKKGEKYCVIPNHSSVLDIPSIFSTGRWPGAVAKKEAFKIPLINGLMWLIHCVKLDRKSPRDAIKAIHDSVNNVENGFPMMIFPEGTRSKNGKIAEFKAGSFKIATRAKAKIVPVAIKNSRQGFEDAHYIGIVPIYVEILPPIDTALLDEEELRTLHTRVENEIRDAYDKLPSFPKKKK